MGACESGIGLSSMFRLTAGETWLDGLELMDPDTGKLNYGTALFINRWASLALIAWVPFHLKFLNPPQKHTQPLVLLLPPSTSFYLFLFPILSPAPLSILSLFRSSEIKPPSAATLS